MSPPLVPCSSATILAVQSNLATTYQLLGRKESALSLRREVYSGNLRVFGTENSETVEEANNYACTLTELKRFEEAKSLLRKMLPVARRVLGEGHDVTLKMRRIYAIALFADPDATLDDLREAVSTLEDTKRITRRVFGGSHPVTNSNVGLLQDARAALRAREAPPSSSGGA